MWCPARLPAFVTSLTRRIYHKIRSCNVWGIWVGSFAGWPRTNSVNRKPFLLNKPSPHMDPFSTSSWMASLFPHQTAAKPVISTIKLRLSCLAVFTSGWAGWAMGVEDQPREEGQDLHQIHPSIFGCTSCRTGSYWNFNNSNGSECTSITWLQLNIL